MESKSKGLSVFTMTLMTVAAVVSLRGLPMMAKEGLSMVFYILFSTFIFLLPASLVAAELGSAFSDKKGGVYTWVKEAYGSKMGFTAIWLQWIQNVVWYPTVLAFAAACLAYVVDKPELASNGVYTGTVILVFYWLATFLTLAGSNVATSITKYGVVLGTLLPGIFIIILGFLWVDQGNPLAFMQEAVQNTDVKSVSKLMRNPDESFYARLFPHINGLGSIAFLGGIILLFAGVEVHAVHATELKNPSTQFPLALMFASAVVLILFFLGSMAIAAVLPAKDISLTAGLMQAFNELMIKFHIDYLSPFIAFLLAFGALGGVMSWISGPSSGLLETAEQGEIPPVMAKTNKNNAPITILIIQGVIVSVLASLYFIMDNVSVAFFILSAMTITLYLVMYMLMYASAIKLRFTQPDLPRAYKVPGGKSGLCIVAGVGFLGVVFALIVCFFPPSQLPVGNPTLYVSLVAGGLVVFGGLPMLIQSMKKPEWRNK